MTTSLERLLPAVAAGKAPQVLLVAGDLVLAEPAAERLAAAWAQALGAKPEDIERHRRPPSLAPLLQDLRTFSLFGNAKIRLAVSTAAFADKDAAALLLADAVAVLPVDAERALTAREKEGAVALLQVLRLHDLDPYADTAERLIARLPDAAFGGGGGKGKGKKGAAEEVRPQLAELLEAARDAELQGLQGSDLAELSDLLHAGLPDPEHVLVRPLVEASE